MGKRFDKQAIKKTKNIPKVNLTFCIANNFNIVCISLVEEDRV